MFPCAVCDRHLRTSEAVCPFCGAEQRSITGEASTMLGALALASTMTLGLAACAPDTVSATGASTSSTTTAAETDTGETSTGTDTDDPTTTNVTTAPGSFYAGPDEDFAGIQDCDPYLQDCPEGEKCVPYGSTGGSWDANKCVPVTGDGAPGEPCTYGGAFEATDDCDESSHCWDVMDVDGQAIGTCTLFCTGSPDQPQCPSGSSCLVSNDGSIALCIDDCDPILQDCGPGLACFWAFDAFNCIFTTQDIPAGEVCGFINDCAAGHHCLGGEFTDVSLYLPDCQGEACCAEVCSLDDPDACPDPQLECVAFFDPDLPEPGYENVGLCVVPP